MKIFSVHMVEHLVEHRHQWSQIGHQKNSFTEVAHGIIERTPESSLVSSATVQKTRFFIIYPPFCASKLNCMTNYH